jgi:hypothetical protein
VMAGVFSPIHALFFARPRLGADLDEAFNKVGSKNLLSKPLLFHINSIKCTSVGAWQTVFATVLALN